MEQLPLLAGGSKASATTPFYLTLDNTTSTSTSSPTASHLAASGPSKQPNHERGTDTIKAKIMSHHLYPALLSVFIDCQKVGAPPEVVGRLSALASELDSQSGDRCQDRSDPELDEFMKTYIDVLVRYKLELTTPIQEADQFFRAMEAQMESFALDTTSCEGGDSSEDEQDIGDVSGLPATITNPCAEDEELKNQLLNKYSGSGYLGSLWRELSKKKKRGKLPRDARQKLLHWWQLHYRWPYPSELEKAALAASTGLDGKQINNWFINQRKRHWKPTAPVPAMEYSFQPTYGASSSTSSSAAHRMQEGHYFTGSGSAYPRGP